MNWPLNSHLAFQCTYHILFSSYQRSVVITFISLLGILIHKITVRLKMVTSQNFGDFKSQLFYYWKIWSSAISVSVQWNKSLHSLCHSYTILWNIKPPFEFTLHSFPMFCTISAEHTLKLTYMKSYFTLEFNIKSDKNMTDAN
jgi:hypothetical protein